MTIKVVVLEDNPITAADLREILESKGFEVLKVFKNADVALREVQDLNPDILLVDISLEGSKTGIDFVHELKMDVPVIYLTGNTDDQTVEEAVGSNPTAFLSKPFKEKDVQIAIELAINQLGATDLESAPAPRDIVDAIFLKSGTRFEKVKIDEIDFLEASGSYCKVHCQEKEYLLSNNLNNYQEFFELKGFIRIHRSFVINPSKVTQINGDSLFIESHELTIGRSYKQAIRNYFPKFS